MKKGEKIYYFDHKGCGGPKFRFETEVIAYIDNELLPDISSRDPEDFKVRFI